MKYRISIFLILIGINYSGYATKVAFTVSRFCYGEATKFNSTSSSKDSIIAFQWDLNGNFNYNDASGEAISFKFASAGIYNVGLQIITDVGDTLSLHKTVTIHPNPVADFSIKIPCSKDSTEFINNSTISSGKVYNQMWDFGDGDRAFLNPNPKHKYGQGGTFKIKLVAISDQGCFDSIGKNITIFPTPIVDIIPDPDSTFYDGESATLTTGVFDQYSWSTGESSSSIVVTQSGTITLDVVDANGCKNSNSILITAMPKLDLEPTDIITPNNDGFNDFWFIDKTGGWKQITVNVYNRYGDEVYASENYQNDWYATFTNGETLPEGTYYYVLKIVDINKVYTGSISILR